MNSPLVSCPKCRATLPGNSFNLPDFTPCPACGAAIQIEVFPALFRRVQPGQAGETILVATDASCFYHPQKKAVVPCESCGRFLCALCDCELHGLHFCPSCLETGKKKGSIKSLENKRKVYDNQALLLAMLPLVLTGLLALYLVIRHWHTPMSLVHPGKTRLIVAAILATTQVLAFAVILFFALAR